jgi:signal transduction histidine kinase/CheY-like chemotaxis protein
MIVQTNDDDEPGLTAILAGRRARLRPRLLLFLLIAVVFAPLVGWLAAAGWAAVCAALAVGEAMLRRNAGAKPMDAALAWLAAEGLIAGGLGALAAVKGGGWGAACGGLYLTLALFAVAAMRRSSAAAYAAGAAPLAAMMVLAAGMAGFASDRLPVGVALAALAFGVIAVSACVWKICAEALAGELRARGEAERRLLEAEAANRAAADFAAMARQALTRPLQAVRAGADSLRRTAPALRAQADRFDDAGARAQAMLDDLRDLADLDAGRMRVERGAFDLSALMGELAAAWAPRAKARGVGLELEGADALPRAVLGDRERLRQVLDGLIGHALEVTDVGAVAVSAHAVRLEGEERGEDDDVAWLVRFGVCDNGPGLRAGEAARLFAPFEVRGEASGRAGAALTLSVGRGIARLMGGDLYAASPGGRGAAFTLEATFAEPLAALAPQTAGDGAQVPRGVRVLVADAQEANRRAAALILEPFGARITEAPSAQAALELLANHAFDLVLMDIDPPGGFSREACRRLRAVAGPNRRTPLIGCAGAAVEGGDWTAAGLLRMVGKPFDPAALRAAAATALQPKPPKATAAA